MQASKINRHGGNPPIAADMQTAAFDIGLFLRLARLRMREHGEMNKPTEALFDKLVDLARRYCAGEDIAELEERRNPK